MHDHPRPHGHRGHRSLARALLLLLPALAAGAFAAATSEPGPRTFQPDDVFELEWATDPQVSPDGKQIAYVRAGYDRMRDGGRSAIWAVDVATGAHRPLVTGAGNVRAPRFSPDGGRLLYMASTAAGSAMRIRWLDTDREFDVATLEEGPSQMTWSPDGTRIAFTMFKPHEGTKLGGEGAHKPEGAQWAEPMKVIDDLSFRFDGAGFLDEGYDQVWVLPADGGTPRQITDGGEGFDSPEWSADGRTLYVVGNDGPDPQLDPIESEIYAVDLASLERTALTDRDGPDRSPKVSPDGKRLAWRGFDDRLLSYQQNDLYVRDLPDGAPRLLTADYDHDLSDVTWNAKSDGLYGLATVQGALHLVEIDLRGRVTVIADDVGGMSIGRPYGAGAYDVVGSGRDRVVAFTRADSARPAELAMQRGSGDARAVTDLNSDALGDITLGRVEELRVPSTHDGLEIQAWVAFPPGWEAPAAGEGPSAPMILEIHGGPFAMYTPAFAAEIQRYAAEGYVTVWANPRGSTGYGEAFAHEIDEAYPGFDHDDLMSVVDAVVAKGWVDEKRLFITGGSGGGVLSAYATGRTDRFAAAAVIKPVINWFTMALSADIGMLVRRHWVRGDPWANPQKFFDLSPIAVVGNVTTPTLVMVGEEDFRTPAWEAEQWYTALKMQGVKAVYVRVPGASHLIARRPSQLIGKTDVIMDWFARHDPAKADVSD